MNRAIRLVYLDYLAMLRERKVWVAAGLYAYTVAVMPALFSKPPAHILGAIEQWFGTSDRFAMFLYMWTDVAMNKLAVVSAVVVAGGIVARERDTGALPLLFSKPISPAGYFLVRLASAGAVLATLHVGAHLAGVVLFSRVVPGFRTGLFLASMALHLFAVLFAAALAATTAVLVKRRAVAMILSMLVLMSLVGASFVGFYQPAWRAASLVNPFTLGVQVLAHQTSLTFASVAGPMVGLCLFIAAMAGAGALSARRVEV